MPGRLSRLPDTTLTGRVSRLRRGTMGAPGGERLSRFSRRELLKLGVTAGAPRSQADADRPVWSWCRAPTWILLLTITALAERIAELIVNDPSHLPLFQPARPRHEPATQSM